MLLITHPLECMHIGTYWMNMPMPSHGLEPRLFTHIYVTILVCLL